MSTPVTQHSFNRFEIIYDGETTEHVFDIRQAFLNVHNTLSEDGIFVSSAGADGWFSHGFYQIGPDVPWRFWHASLGYDVLGCWTFSRADRTEPTEIPDPTNSPRGAERQFEKLQFIFYVVKKNPQPEKEAPVIQSHYVNY
ncbi:MAG: hypothetical protein AAGF27_01905 [Pseudomonadota bacterium]